MRILIVEDEQRLAAALAQLLKERQYAVDVAHDGNTGLDLALTDCYDLLVLDVMLPGQSGLDIVRQVRQAGLDVPILLLTAKDTVDDRVTGLDAGADDYLVKPFATKELLARIRALTRRTGNVSGPDTLTVGPFSMHLAERTIFRDGQPLSLTAKEFQLLELLMRNHGKVMSKELILDRVWGPDAEVIGNAVENYVHFLRKKIDVPGRPSYIETVRGVGYVFRVRDSQEER
ncbi:response regulator transcription factor [Alicyclobacillus macrosporangiidus]|uniref:DNA-binding response regulator, OmpR family, contains REC and winged-helix (WHTH) domain n=1 Tax=Alicyclobacillus macrosporangiidus TaxID=392015 RepID=A0A1I7GX12_9BACL|nr:response regulator transcription factor [Alicyclobacillus macrosporangiidus]SFU52972.1 DNA-binding response regulator, OmpR family, contains REC and winged-helix (wHTH) domain [Alicyclobacillus macrosporangiidus]